MGSTGLGSKVVSSNISPATSQSLAVMIGVCNNVPILDRDNPKLSSKNVFR